jgi:aspartate-semialdehyde dehydrogenase
MAVRVPLAIGHGMHVRVSLQSVIALDDILECLSCCPYIKIEDRGDVDIKGSHMVFVSRVRLEGSVLDLWIASDNLIRGAAYNMCEIAKWCFDLREKNDVC